LREVVIALSLALLAFVFPIAQAESDKGEALDNPLGQYRILAMCMINDENLSPDRVIAIYKSIDWAEFLERDLLLVEITSKGINTVLGKQRTSSNGVKVATWNRVKHTDQDKLVKKVACQDNFDFVLIGKDTSVKKRWQGFLPLDDLYETIDAMPMRRHEMSQRKKRD